MPASRPSTIAKRETGAANRRSVNPISMSSAARSPPELPASSTDCTIAPASMKSRKPSTVGEARQVDGAAGARRSGSRAAAVGKTTSGAASCGRRSVCLTERVPSAATTRAFAARRSITRASTASGSPASSVRRPRGAARSWRRRRRPGSAAPGRATRPRARPRPARRTIGPTSEAPCSSSTSSLPVPGGQRLAEARQDLLAVGSLPAWSTSESSRCGLADLGLERLGVPSATSLPPAMIPTRSASLSASSRYWVVRKTVVPSSFSFSTSSQIAWRLTGSRPVVGSSRKRTAGSWTSAAARSRRRRIPPE